MSKVDVVEILKKSDALLEGHFLLSSGKHSNRYVQCAKVLRFPEYAEQVLSTVVEQIKDLDIDLVVGPAMGGVIVSYELGRQLGKETVFTERKDGEMETVIKIPLNFIMRLRNMGGIILNILF